MDCGPPFMKDHCGKCVALSRIKKKNEFKRNNVKMVYNRIEMFLGPRIWEIVPDDIKISNSLEEFKLKNKY